jgi:sentrin-specific protease 1
VRTIWNWISNSNNNNNNNNNNSSSSSSSSSSRSSSNYVDGCDSVTIEEGADTDGNVEVGVSLSNVEVGVRVRGRGSDGCGSGGGGGGSGSGGGSGGSGGTGGKSESKIGKFENYCVKSSSSSSSSSSSKSKYVDDVIFLYFKSGDNIYFEDIIYPFKSRSETREKENFGKCLDSHENSMITEQGADGNGNAADGNGNPTSNPAVNMAQPLTNELIECRYRALTREESSQVTDILRGDVIENVIIIDKYNVAITNTKIRCLKPETWLNDEVINFYMQLLTDRDELLSKRYSGRRRSHFFNTFFVERLLKTDNEYTYNNVKRWSKKIDIFELDKIFFPINIDNSHWSLAVVYPQLKQIQYFDSLLLLGDEGSYFMSGLLRWVIDEAQNRKKVTIDPKTWTLINRSHEIPRQENSYDCGMFTIICSDFLLDNLPINVDSYSQEKMPFLRLKVASFIFKGELDYSSKTIIHHTP